MAVMVVVMVATVAAAAAVRVMWTAVRVVCATERVASRCVDGSGCRRRVRWLLPRRPRSRRCLPRVCTLAAPPPCCPARWPPPTGGIETGRCARRRAPHAAACTRPTRGAPVSGGGSSGRQRPNPPTRPSLPSPLPIGGDAARTTVAGAKAPCPAAHARLLRDLQYRGGRGGARWGGWPEGIRAPITVAGGRRFRRPPPTPTAPPSRRAGGKARASRPNPPARPQPTNPPTQRPTTAPYTQNGTTTTTTPRQHLPPPRPHPQSSSPCRAAAAATTAATAAAARRRQPPATAAWPPSDALLVGSGAERQTGCSVAAALSLRGHRHGGQGREGGGAGGKGGAERGQ